LQTLWRACAIGREEGAEGLAQDFVYLGNPLAFVGTIPLEANEKEGKPPASTAQVAFLVLSKGGKCGILPKM